MACVLALGAALLGPALACAAPGARAVEGAVGEQIAQGIAGGRQAFDHGAYDALLRKHVDAAGRVSYSGLRAERAPLDGYLAQVAKAPLASLSRPELFALFLNAYNACTLRLILDQPALPKSIRDLSSPWGQKVCTVGGHTLSLDDIEHGVLRPVFKDVRIHAAVNCASRSCPKLRAEAFRGDRLEAQLQQALEEWVRAPEQVRVEGGGLKVSKIFDWYGKDFVDPTFAGHAPSVRELVQRHASPEQRAAIEKLGPSPSLGFLDYDWSLNGN